MLPRERRLTKKSEFATVYSQGRAWANDLFVMKAIPNQLGLTRYGFLVSKRVGKAVVRNRIKRLLREGARLTPIEPGWDIIFIAREATATCNYYQIKKAMEELFCHAHLLKGTQ